jgi:1,4-dihydroxy-2-naphthoate octaprenyltransferase
MSGTRAQAVIGPMRPNFLLLTPCCVILGAAAAHWTGHSIDWGRFLLVLAGALAAHVAVNALNEYSDFRSGLDLKTLKTPFSGGTGTLPAQPDRAHYALITGIVSLAVAAAIGVTFALEMGWGLLPLGLLGLVTIVAYTPAITRNWLLCLVAPGLGFGPLMVMGTEYCLTGAYSTTGLVASLVPFFLVSNLLLLNQFPDQQPDRDVGRDHLIITTDKRRGVAVYGLFLILAYLVPVVGWLLDVLPLGGMLALLAAPLAAQTFAGVRRHFEDVSQLLPFMGRNVVLNLLTPVLLAVGMFLGF